MIYAVINDHTDDTFEVDTDEEMPSLTIFDSYRASLTEDDLSLGETSFIDASAENLVDGNLDAARSNLSMLGMTLIRSFEQIVDEAVSALESHPEASRALLRGHVVDALRASVASERPQEGEHAADGGLVRVDDYIPILVPQEVMAVADEIGLPHDQIEEA